MKKSYLISILIITLLLSSFSVGCSSKSSQKETKTKDVKTNKEVKETKNNNIKEEATTSEDKYEFPLKEPVKLTCWMKLSQEASLIAETAADLPLYKEYKEQTGVEIEFLHPPNGQSKEQFNLIIASGDYPDVMFANWNSFYPGGSSKAYNDGILVPFNEYESYTPYINELRKQKVIDKELKNDDGVITAIPLIRETAQGTVLGPVVRKDWLDEFNLPIPETIDEWETLLTLMKEKKNAVGLCSASFNGSILCPGSFIGAYGTVNGLYMDDNKVKFGALEPGYRQALELFNRWYDKGLLDKDFTVVDRKAMHAKVLGDRSGAFVGYVTGDMTKLLMNRQNQGDTEFDLIGTPYPVLNKGDKPEYAIYSGIFSYSNAAAITKNCDNPEIAAKWIDYRYGGQGAILNNFGIEGTSYELKDGVPTLTDLIIKNPDGKSIKQALASYSNANFGMACFQFEDLRKQTRKSIPQVSKTLASWNNNNGANHYMPNATFTTKEAKEFATIMNDVDTYLEECTVKFIMGIKSFDEYDDFVKMLEKLGIRRALELKQEACDRYYNR